MSDLAARLLRVYADADFSNADTVGSPTLSITQGSILIQGLNPAIIPINSTRFVTIGSRDPATVLPVDLVHFNAQLQEEGKVKLNWTVSLELDHKWYEVERSTDMSHWEAIGRLEGKFNNNRTGYYYHIDSEPKSGVNFYRLKMVDINGLFTYSPTRSIFNHPARQLRIYPHPTGDLITISGSKTELSQFTLFNIDGKVVLLSPEDKWDGTLSLS